jgi:hypothetical protein
MLTPLTVALRCIAVIVRKHTTPLAAVVNSRIHSLVKAGILFNQLVLMSRVSKQDSWSFAMLMPLTVFQ